MAIVPASARTCAGLGRAQGAAVADGKVYLYGDADPGVIREYRLAAAAPGADLVPTGRAASLTRNGIDLLNHPTGLAMHGGLPCFVGNTVTATKQGRIYRLDIEQALRSGTVDGAILNDALDDLAVQGSRPEYVRMGGRWLIATSDYGPGPNFVRFYDPAALAHAERTSAPGVLVRSVPCGAWVQSLHWIDRTHTLVIIQNIIEGRRWRLTLVSDLTAADYRTAPGVRVVDLPGHDDELEGYAEIKPGIGVFVTSSQENNVTFAVPQQ
jgi:hypothetical protein